MKKVILVVILVVVFATWALAANNKGPTTYAPTVDVQGAHENGGRGCAGCHAPHSGGRGAGGGAGSVIAQTYAAAGVPLGDNGLWGTDTTAIIAGGGNLSFSGYAVSLTGAAWGAAGAQGPLYTGVATCLSCHDGNVSRGAMMSGVAYEQAWGLLNFATTAGSNGTANAVSLYGTQPIPTLLGNDGGTVGDYLNDHPIGPQANLGRVAKAALGNGLVISWGTTNNVVDYTNYTASATTGTYGEFVAQYGLFATSNLANPGDGVVGNLFVVCTTCHNQHVMNVYGGGHGAQPIAGGAVTSARTIFFVGAPYNPGSPYDPTHVPSTNAFCLQCHFSHSSQYYGSAPGVIGVAY